MLSSARIALLVTLPMVAVMPVVGLASGCTHSESDPQPPSGDDAGHLPTGQGRDAQADVLEEQDEDVMVVVVEDAAIPEPEAGPACNDTPIGSICRPASTICCDLGGCDLKGNSGTRYCCLGPTKPCTFAEECCGFEACTDGTCKCQPTGQTCWGNAECCNGPCSGSATGTPGTCP